MTPNPFISGNPVEPANFFNRKQPLRRVVGRLLSGGQSTAVIGEPRLGKTSLLKYLAARETRADLYGEQAERLLIAFMDSHTFSGQFTAAQFWEQVFAAADLEFAIHNSPNPLLGERYRLCRENEFGPFTLEALFRILKIQGWRLALLLDEFDALLHHPILNSAEFFGGLRSLSSRSEGALALVIGSRLPLAQLNARTQAFNPTGSPYFNIFTEITLGAFPEKDIDDLLNRAGEYFTPLDKRAIRTIAGGHPFLLQTAAEAMWGAHERGLQEINDRRRAVAEQLYDENKGLFATTWSVWTPAWRITFTTVALAHLAHLLTPSKFLSNAFITGLRDFGPELNDLKNQGFITQDEHIRGGWRVAPQAMLWWLADKLIAAVRADTPLEKWLRVEGLDNLLTPPKQDQLNRVVRGASQALGQGAMTLVEAFARSLGE